MDNIGAAALVDTVLLALRYFYAYVAPLLTEKAVGWLNSGLIMN